MFVDHNSNYLALAEIERQRIENDVQAHDIITIPPRPPTVEEIQFYNRAKVNALAVLFFTLSAATLFNLLRYKEPPIEEMVSLEATIPLSAQFYLIGAVGFSMQAIYLCTQPRNTPISLIIKASTVALFTLNGTAMVLSMYGR